MTSVKLKLSPATAVLPNEKQEQEQEQETKKQTAPTVTTSTSTSNTSTSTTDSVSDLLREVSESQRIQAINRIFQSLAINPIEILQLPIPYTTQDIKRQYRKLSLLVHPDRCPQKFKVEAEKAFAKLAAAKHEISTPEFEKKLKHHLIEARRRITERRMTIKAKQFVLNNNHNNNHNSNSNQNNQNRKLASKSEIMPPLKRVKLNDETILATKNSHQNQTSNENENANTNNNNNNSNNKRLDEDISECELKSELREILIDDAWQQRIENKFAQKFAQKQQEYRQELKQTIATDKKWNKAWHEKRDKRVNSWRDFQNKKKKKKKKGKHKKKI
jgi:DnaJ family protein C protein 8